MGVPTLYRIIVPVDDIDAAAAFYERILGFAGTRVSPGRHYFDCDGTILACFHPASDGDDLDLGPLPDHLYLAVDDLEAARARLLAEGRPATGIESQPWGEQTVYSTDPFGNRLCFVARETVFRG